ncbi:MAG: hypothetical protein R3F60_12945 [bacterium]
MHLTALIALATPPGVVVSVSPAHLLLPLAEVQVEAPLSARLAVVLIAGAGAIALDPARRYTVLEGGGQVRLYPVPDAGAHLAVEALASHAAGREGQASSLGAGALAGWQWESDQLVVEVGAGAGYRLARHHAHADGRALTHGERGLQPILNLNLGYRF